MPYRVSSSDLHTIRRCLSHRSVHVHSTLRTLSWLDVVSNVILFTLLLCADLIIYHVVTLSIGALCIRAVVFFMLFMLKSFFVIASSKLDLERPLSRTSPEDLVSRYGAALELIYSSRPFVGFACHGCCLDCSDDCSLSHPKLPLQTVLDRLGKLTDTSRGDP